MASSPPQGSEAASGSGDVPEPAAQPPTSAAPAAAPSKAQQETASKEAMAALKKGSANSLHAVLRLMARDDIRIHVRMVGLATAAYATEHARQQRYVKGAPESVKQMADWSCWSWLGQVKQSFSTCGDWVQLERCGLVARPTVKRKRGAATERDLEAERMTHAGHFEQYWKLCFYLAQQHTTSYVHYTSSFPCILAGCQSTSGRFGHLECIRATHKPGCTTAHPSSNSSRRLPKRFGMWGEGFALVAHQWQCPGEWPTAPFMSLAVPQHTLCYPLQLRAWAWPGQLGSALSSFWHIPGNSPLTHGNVLHPPAIILQFPPPPSLAHNLVCY